MPTNPNKLSQFWQELKRRKVVRVITVYAAAAFVILELVDILAPSLRLPDWTLNLVLILLCVGFIIAIILSWIYDIHPEEGIVKTKPAHKVKKENKPTSSNSWRIASYISFMVIVGLILINVIPRGNKDQEIENLEKSIAVLPFENLSEERGNEYFVDGLVEDLLNRISVIEELKVISRTSSEMYREKGDKSVRQIAEELNVSYILEGSVQRYGQKARITVQLIDARNDDHIWVDSYDRDVVDVFKTQNEIAIQIASELNTILTTKQRSLMQEDKTLNVKAFELYQMGKFYWNKRTEDGCAKSIENFELAIKTDPGYGLAYAGLADTYYIMAIYRWIDDQTGINKAVELALKALELDGNLAEAYTVLASIYDYFYWDWEEAENAYQRALELNPNYATAHQYYAEHLSIIGQLEEARKHMNKAVELNPLSFIIRNASAKLYYHQGYFEEALRELDICDEIQKDHFRTTDIRYRTYWQLDQEDQAFEALRATLSEDPHYDLKTAEKIYQESGLRSVFQWMSEIDLAIAEEAKLQYILSERFALMGMLEEALYWLEKAFQLRQTSEMSYNIAFRSLHDQPRYQAIVKEMGLAGRE